MAKVIPKDLLTDTGCNHTLISIQLKNLNSDSAYFSSVTVSKSLANGDNCEYDTWDYETTNYSTGTAKEECWDQFEAFYVKNDGTNCNDARWLAATQNVYRYNRR